MDSEILSPSQAVKLLEPGALSENKLRRLMRGGKVPKTWTVPGPGRYLRISRTHFIKWAKQHDLPLRKTI